MKQVFISFILIIAMVGASIPVHSIIHQHHFISKNSHEAKCKKEMHLQAHQKHCCQVASALNKNAVFTGERHESLLDYTFNKFLLTTEEPLFQSVILPNNKAPPFK